MCRRFRPINGNSSISLRISARALPFLRMMVACSMVVAFDSHHVNESKRKKKKTRLNTLIESQKCRVETLFYYCLRSLNRSFCLLLFFPPLFSTSIPLLPSSRRKVRTDLTEAVNRYFDRISLKLFWLIKTNTQSQETIIARWKLF